MDKREAREVIANELAKYRTWSYDQLRAIVDAPKRTFEVTGDVRVTGCIDDGGWSAFLPITDSFIKAPDGSFVGEAEK